MSALYGIIGYPLSHSFSPGYFNKKFAALHIDASYSTYPLAAIEEFPTILDNNPNIVGLNVTIPYKQSVIPYLDEIDAVARDAGAVNCITIKDGYKKGYNTDVLGFERSLTPLLQSQHNHALILGTGGASKAVAYALKQLGIAYQKVSRKKKDGVLNYDDLTEDIMTQHTLLINTTPLGMYPNVDFAPDIPYQFIGTSHLLYDLIYNPEETKFLSLGKANGATIKNGYEMLILQAEANWEIWNRP